MICEDTQTVLKLTISDCLSLHYHYWITDVFLVKYLDEFLHMHYELHSVIYHSKKISRFHPSPFTYMFFSSWRAAGRM